MGRVIKYLFMIDDVPKAPIRDTWEEAAKDAEDSKYGRWKDSSEFLLDKHRGAQIRAIK